MTIQFPSGDQLYDGKVHEAEGLTYIYDEANLSWNLIGPDNVATIDYVDQVVLGDARNIRRNYDISRSKSDITLDDSFNTLRITECDNTAVSSLTTELFTDSGVDLPSGQMNDLADILVNGYTIPEWVECIAYKINDGEVAYLGYDTVSRDGSTDITKTVAYFFSPESLDANNLTEDSIIVDSTLELQRTLLPGSNGFTDNAYSIYKVIEKFPFYNGAEFLGLGVSVLHEYYYNGENEDPNYLEGQPHKFVAYVKAVTKAGADIEGAVNITYSGDALTVSETDNPDTMVLKVDTVTPNITTNQAYVDMLKQPGDQSEVVASLATVNYVNTRLGYEGEGYSTKSNGPFLQLKGGKCIGKVVFDDFNRSNDSKSFTIVGKPTPNADKTDERQRRDMFYFVAKADGDRIFYRGLMQDRIEIVNKGYVDDKVDTLKSDTEATYVKKSGDSMTGTITVTNTIANRTPQDNELTPWKQVKTISIATVADNPPSGDITPGMLYESNGVLYYKTYKT